MKEERISQISKTFLPYKFIFHVRFCVFSSEEQANCGLSFYQHQLIADGVKKPIFDLVALRVRSKVFFKKNLKKGLFGMFCCAFDLEHEK